MKNQKENSIMIGNTNYSCSAYSKLFLNSRSSRNLNSLNQTNRSNVSNDKRSKSKQSERKNQDNSNLIKLVRKFTNKNKNQKKNEESKTISLQNSRKIQQALSSKNRQDTNTYRKVDIQQKQITISKSKINMLEKSIESEKSLRQRPHYSQNLSKNNKIQNGVYKKLYTFCEQNSKSNNQKSKPNQTNINFEADKYNIRTQLSTNSGYDYSLNTSTIIVKEEQLKRFTHKFAREKIQFQQISQQMKNQIAELQRENQLMVSERKQLISYIQTKQQEIQGLNQKIQQQNFKILGTKVIQEQKNKQNQENLGGYQMRIANLQKQLQQKSTKLQQILFELDKRQKQIYKLQYENQNSKFFLPMSNINHVISINSSLSNQAPSYEILEELQYLRGEYNRCQFQQNQQKRLSSYLKIQNEHLERELEIEKLTSNTLTKQIDQLRIQIQQNRCLLNNLKIPDSPFGKLDDSCFEHKQTQQLKDEIVYLLQQNAELLHSKQTLQKSLKVSSEMILHLKEENTKLKLKLQKIFQQNYHDKRNKQIITVQHVKLIVRNMMKEQLELEQKFKYSSMCDSKIPVYNENLQKKYQEGYQSIKQAQKRRQHYKTQKTETNEDYQNYQKRNYTQISFVDQFNSQIYQYKNSFGSPNSNF